SISLHDLRGVSLIDDFVVVEVLIHERERREMAEIIAACHPESGHGSRTKTGDQRAVAGRIDENQTIDSRGMVERIIRRNPSTERVSHERRMIDVKLRKKPIEKIGQ